MTQNTPKAIRDLSRQLVRAFVIIGMDEFHCTFDEEGSGVQVQIDGPVNLIAAGALAAALQRFLADIEEVDVMVLSLEEVVARNKMARDE